MSSYQITKNPFLARRPYVYAIMWTDLNLAYLGVRYGKDCHPDDLWKTYFTSSEFVRETRLLHGEPDHIEIIETFLTLEEATYCELEIISTFELHRNPAFLNRACGRATCVEKSPAVRAKISAKLKGRKRSPEECEAISKAKKGRKGRRHSDETKLKMRLAKLGKKNSPEHCANMGKALAGKKRGPLSAEAKAKISAAKKGRKIPAEVVERVSKALKGKPWSAARRAAHEASKAKSE